MRRRRLSIAAVVAVVVGSGLVAADAAASEVADLWVSGANTNCTDAGVRTQAQPYCTIGAAAAVVSAGQTVHVITAGYPEHVTIARSGTPDAPIVFTGTPLPAGLSGPDPGITIDGQHDVTVTNLMVNHATGIGVAVSNAAGITIDHVSVSSVGTDPAIRFSSVTESTITHSTVSGRV